MKRFPRLISYEGYNQLVDKLGAKETQEHLDWEVARLAARKALRAKKIYREPTDREIQRFLDVM
jgi:hypothetical protein